MMNFADKALTDRIGELLAEKANLEKTISEFDAVVDALRAESSNKSDELSELRRTKRMHDDALVTWFQDNLNESDDDSILVSVEDINAILGYLGLGPIARERMWTVEGTASVPFTATVKASTQDEAHEMVENASFSLECHEYFEGFDCSHYDISVDITDVYPE